MVVNENMKVGENKEMIRWSEKWEKWKMKRWIRSKGEMNEYIIRIYRQNYIMGVKKNMKEGEDKERDKWREKWEKGKIKDEREKKEKGMKRLLGLT